MTAVRSPACNVTWPGLGSEDAAAICVPMVAATEPRMKSRRWSAADESGSGSVFMKRSIAFLGCVESVVTAMDAQSRLAQPKACFKIVGEGGLCEINGDETASWL